MKFELNKIYLGDYIEVIPGFDENSIDSIVTDPPYKLAFMGKEWDKLDNKYKEGKEIPCETCNGEGEIIENYNNKDIEMACPDCLGSGINIVPACNPMEKFHLNWAKECLRVLKPGGHILSFGGTRTYHRMVCGIEDAGFEIRDTLQWIYGSGFPKSLDIGKQVDKIQGNEREVVGKESIGTYKSMSRIRVEQGYRKNLTKSSNKIYITKGNSEWEGFGTGLKPACEMIVLARKPLSEKNVALNVLKWGTGGINIDGCRISTNDKLGGGSEKYCDFKGKPGWDRPWMHDEVKQKAQADKIKQNVENAELKGRWPSNVLLNDEAAALLDEQSGERKAGGKVKGHEPSRTGDRGIYSKWGRVENNPFYDKGGASRFFYVAKASKSERNAGLKSTNKTLTSHGANPSDWEKADWSKVNNNNHPTVKPIKLMRYLVRLITLPGGICLDPFGGSGTTGIGCILEGIYYIIIEKEKEYFDISEKRIFHYKREGRLF